MDLWLFVRVFSTLGSFLTSDNLMFGYRGVESNYPRFCVVWVVSTDFPSAPI